VTDKETYLQVRASKEDKALAKNLAGEYGTSVSELIRLALVYIDENRPSLTLTISPQGKVAA